MTFDIWKECNGETNISEINEVAWRVVELQEKTSTRKLVDSIEEQKVLEEIIEESKPGLLNSQSSYHPLLYTPFRYPPLKNGSRFGKKTEPSLWYGSLTPETAMAEKAYYLLAFINASDGNFGTIISNITIFSVKLSISKGIELNKDPFLQYKDEISSPISYEISQLLGQKMRESDIDGFMFISARDAKSGVNIGLFNMESFANKKPNSNSFQTWQCNTNKTVVEFIRVGSVEDQVFTFSINSFMINDVFPSPST